MNTIGEAMVMASGLRAKLRILNASVPAKTERPSRGGLLVRDFRMDPENGIESLSGIGMRRIGWSGRAFDARKCLFLDTETTGLSHGAGTVAFLVGVGFLENNYFRIEQYLMRDYADEPDLIDRLANRMDAFDCVCTFNGRSFDMPLLEQRFTMCRLRHRWRDLENIDLLHPAKRAWKLRLGSCRLGNLEEKILNMPRIDDLPGSEVPQRYFDFLKTGNLDLLEDIILHNRQDIATLQTLLVRLCALYAEPETAGEKRDLFSVGKALEKQGEVGAARELYRRAAVPAVRDGTLRALSEESVTEMANWRLFLIARREGNAEEMRAVLEKMLARNQQPARAHLELAKLYEHRIKNMELALKHARLARSLAENPDQPEWDRRIQRLEKKRGGNDHGIHGRI
ncbi:MAG: ribonuclease H-like domain-containing protein [Clostridia bacterium]|nr:ribonuclease H-like domain-containing protein [Clostridia bacterium]